MSGIFGHGDFRIYLLKLLEESPRHGYELIRLLEDETVGVYTPSAGSVYPRLAALEEEGLIEHDQSEGRKVYRITIEGRRELMQRREQIDAVGERLRSARQVATDIREEVRSSVEDLRRELRAAAMDARDAAREHRRRTREEARREARDATGEAHRALRAVSQDLQAFVSDVLASARHHRIDRDRLAALRDVLRQTRAVAIEALTGSPPARGEPEEK